MFAGIVGRPLPVGRSVSVVGTAIIGRWREREPNDQWPGRFTEASPLTAPLTSGGSGTRQSWLISRRSPAGRRAEHASTDQQGREPAVGGAFGQRVGCAVCAHVGPNVRPTQLRPERARRRSRRRRRNRRSRSPPVAAGSPRRRPPGHPEVWPASPPREAQQGRCRGAP